MYYGDYNRSPEEQIPIESTAYRVHVEETPKKKHLGVKITAACLVCALVGGMAGGGGVLLASGTLGKSTTMYEGVRTPTVVNMVSANTLKALTIPEIYATYANSTVGITTEIVTTNGWGQPVNRAAAGSGFVITNDGYILTNYHVISGANSIKASFKDGNSYTATLVGGDEENDIAVLKIEATNLTSVVVGDSGNMHVGETVVAIGNPLGELTYSLTSGVVSALDRNITMSDGTVMNMMQTDTAINNGNSGGPLFNIYGEVIGITTAKLSSSNISSEATIEGLGFAIPINDVKTLITDIIENGYVTGKPFLGITPVTVTTVDSQQYGLAVGVYVNNVESGSAAEKAGLQKGDVITAVGDTALTQVSDLKGALKKYKAGDTTTLTVDRNGTSSSIPVTFDEQKPETKTAPQEQQQQSTQGYSEWPFGNLNPFSGNGYGY